MEAFERYCLPHRLDALLALRDAPVSLAFDMLLRCGLECASKRVCTRYATCERLHNALRPRREH